MDLKTPSFFSFFNDLKATEKKDHFYEEILEDLELDKEIATEIADELIPRAIYYYLGLIKDDEDEEIPEKEEEKPVKAEEKSSIVEGEITRDESKQ